MNESETNRAMSGEKRCPQCGAPLPAGVLKGLCPACLLQQGAAPDTGTQPEAAPFQPLNVAEVARLFPQLEILELLGQGGMGAVYKARQPGLDRLVALKILPPQAGSGAGFTERFTREARALARLNHPHIVAVHEFGQVGTSGADVSSATVPVAGGQGPGTPAATGTVAGTPAGGTPAPLPSSLHYFIMEFVDGVNLRQLEQAGRLSPREALQIIPQICDALQFAHDEGIVHRDIKPENILLDKKGRVKIADFGIAKILSGEPPGVTLTDTKHAIGTPHYMAPEQVEKPQTVDHRADIYSLGVVFYEMLTGELPLGRFAPPSRKVQVDVRLDEVVLHALEKEPERRYQHASEVKTDVETITQTQGTTPPPPAPAVSAGLSSRLEDVCRQVKGPAIGLVVTGLLNWITIPLLLLVMLFMLARQDESAGWLVLVPLAALILSCVMLVAGLKMKRLEAYGLAITGSILAILVSPGNLIGLPIGIWSLVVLLRREVREAFGKGHSLPANTMASIAAPPVQRPDRFWKRFAVAMTLALLAPLLALILISVGAMLLAIALPALHRMKSPPPNVTVTGVVSDAATGQPIRAARVADLIYAASPRREPQVAGTDAQGRYSLATWYEEHTIAASAPGYKTKLATLLTKPLGQETEVRMDFQLQPTNAGVASPVASPSQPAPAPEVLRIQLRQAEAELARLTDLFRQKLVAEAELDAARNNVAVLKAELDGDRVEAARVRLRGAERQLQRAAGLFQARTISQADYDAAKASAELRRVELADAMTQDGRSNPVAFGPVIERVITSVFTDVSTCFLDLETGEFRVPPPQLLAELRGAANDPALGKLKRNGPLHDWLKQSGADLMGGSLENVATLLFFETRCAAVQDPGQAFDAVKPEWIVNWPRSLPPDPVEPGVFPPLQVYPVRLWLEPWRSANSIPFRTQAGTLGVIQVLSLTDNPRGVKLRYKLVQPADSASATLPQAVSSRTFALRHRLASDMADDLGQILLGRFGMEVKPAPDNMQLTVAAPPEVLNRVTTFIAVNDWPDRITRGPDYHYPREHVEQAARSFFYACSIEDAEGVARMLAPGLLAQLRGTNLTAHGVLGEEKDAELVRQLRANWPGKEAAVQRVVMTWNRFPLRQLRAKSGVAIGFGVRYFASAAFEGAPEDFTELSFAPDRVAGTNGPLMIDTLPPWFNTAQTNPASPGMEK